MNSCDGRIRVSETRQIFLSNLQVDNLSPTSFPQSFHHRLRIRPLQSAAACRSTVMSVVIPSRLDNFDSFRPRRIISAHDDYIWRLLYLPDGRRIVTASHDETVKVWNLENGVQEGVPMEHNAINSLAMTWDGTKIIGSNEYGDVKVWDIESHELVQQWSHPEGSPRIAISPDDRLVAIGKKNIVLYTKEGRPVNHAIEVSEVVLTLCFSPDSNKLACGTHNDIRVYDVVNGCLLLGPLDGHEDWVRCILWSPDGSRLFSASHDKTILCWNFGEQIGHSWTGHTDTVFTLSLSPDGSILASASEDRTVRFWDAISGHPIGQCLQHVGAVIAVCFSPSGEFVASAGWDGKIYLWRAPPMSQASSTVSDVCN